MPSDAIHEQEHAGLPAPEPQKALPEPDASLNGPPVKKSSGGLVRKLVILLVLLAVAGFIYWRIHSNNQQEAVAANRAAAAARAPIPVTTLPVQSRTMPIYLTELGTVTAYNTVTIKTRVDGQLLTVNVREGQQVKQGQVIAEIDPRPYAAAVAQAEGQLAKDQAAADYAKSEAGRYTALYQAGVVSKESEQTQVSNAGASVGTLAADRAAIQAAKVNLGYTRIVSPINGVVGLRQVDAGNIVHAADTTGLILVTQLQPIAVVFTLPEDSLPSVLKTIRSGKKLVVEAFDRSQSTHLATGTLLTVDNQIDTTTGTVKGKAVFDNKEGTLFPNQFVNVRLVLEDRANSLVVPAAAIQTGANGNFVYVVKECGAKCPEAEGNGGTAHAGADGGTSAGSGGGQSQEKPGPKYYVDIANVVLDLTEGSQVILKSGVNPGDQLVVDGQEKLKKNSRVLPSVSKSGRRAQQTDMTPASRAAEPTGLRSTGSPGSINGGGSQQ